MNRHVGSIFDVFKIGVGPSSSHTLAPVRAARIFLERLGGPPARIRVTLRGSLAETGKGHLTDRSIAAVLSAVPHEFIWDTRTAALPHPNTLEFEALDASGGVLQAWTVFSTGGGSLADDKGPVGEADPARHPCANISEALQHCEDEQLTYWQFVERHENAVWRRLEEVWAAMKASLERGLSSDQVVLPGTLKLPRRAGTTYLRAQSLRSPERDIALLSAFALAVAEENANGGDIVTAPSCGPAGVLAGLLYYFEAIRGLPQREILRAIATAGLFGSVIRSNASVSGAEVGCQGEIGSACSMAAAAGSQLMGGSLRQIEYAAEIAMEHHLGLTCDPVEGYVQIPCIERNMTGCLRAFESASFSLLTDGRHLVSFDEVVEVMYRTGLDLQSAYRETARGGLASIWRKRMTRRPEEVARPARPVASEAPGGVLCD